MENENGHTFRIEKIKEIELSLQNDRDERDVLSKRYSKTYKWFSNLEIVLIVVSLGLGATGVCLLSTIKAIQSVVALESITIGINVLSIIGKIWSQKFSLKAEKHKEVKILAESKLNVISDMISKSSDGRVSDLEFSIILAEYKKYQETKNDIIEKNSKSSR